MKFSPFPYDRYDGQGFLREPEVDTEFVKTWHGNGNGGVPGASGSVEEAATGD